MFVRTGPREIAARWIHPGDEVALFDPPPTTPPKTYEPARTEEFVRQHAVRISWWLVVNISMVPPPAKPEVGREEGTVRHSLGGQFSVEPQARGFVPDGLDHVGAHALVMMPTAGDIVWPDGRRLQRKYWAGEEEQLVIRERVRVDPLEYTENMFGLMTDVHADADALRRLTDEVPETEGQRAGAGVTVAEIDQPGVILPLGPGISGPGGPIERGQTTMQLATRYLPVFPPGEFQGVPYGRTVPESDAVDFRSERESDGAA